MTVMRSVQTEVPVQVSTRRKHLAVPTEPMRSGCLKLAGHGSSDHRMRQALWCLVRCWSQDSGANYKKPWAGLRVVRFAFLRSLSRNGGRGSDRSFVVRLVKAI